MKEAPSPNNEKERLLALEAYQVMDTEEEGAFDELTELAAIICDKPIALVSLIDGKRQWFKSHYGLDVRETPRCLAFCGHAILEDEVFEVRNSLADPRFSDNPLVTGDPKVIFYAGAQLVTPEGHKIGTMCVINSKPDALTEQQRRSLKSIANQVVRNLEYRKSLIDLKIKNDFAENMNVRLKSANEELSQFAYRTSHDLKAPLITVQGLARAISEDIRDQNYNDVERNAILIEKNVRKLEVLVVDILNLAKADLLTTKNEKIDLAEIIADIRATLSMVYVDANVNIEVECNHSIDFLESKTRVTQVLENLISNGIKYCDIEKPHRFVKVTTAEDDTHLIITVEDNGLGIPSKFKDRVYNMFERFHQNVSMGSGLGMYIVKKHIDKMDASIDFVSSDAGTKFEVRFQRERLERLK